VTAATDALNGTDALAVALGTLVEVVAAVDGEVALATVVGVVVGAGVVGAGVVGAGVVAAGVVAAGAADEVVVLVAAGVDGWVRGAAPGFPPAAPQPPEEARPTRAATKSR
jgi:hypothetical protein